MRPKGSTAELERRRATALKLRAEGMAQSRLERSSVPAGRRCRSGRGRRGRASCARICAPRVVSQTWAAEKSENLSASWTREPMRTDFRVRTGRWTVLPRSSLIRSGSAIRKAASGTFSIGGAGAASARSAWQPSEMIKRSRPGSGSSSHGPKKWVELKATLVFLDEMGSSKVVPIKSTWARRGQTPSDPDGH